MDALQCDEVDRLVTMGLGRGVRATDPKPFLNKSSFQVRKVTFDNIIGTEEHGTQRSYDGKVSSSSAIHTALKASTATLTPVTLGVDSEFSRGKTQSRMLSGVKVLNRTVSFKEDFKGPGTSVAVPGMGERGSDSTFEERLCQWILAQMQDKGIPVPETGDNPIQILTTMIKDSSGEELQKITDLLEMECLSFVYQHRITHYVSKLKLGASHYKLLKEEEYQIKAKAGTNIGPGVVQVEGDVEQKRSRRTSRQLKIGLITEHGTCERRSPDEAVIGVQVRPISQLITLLPLHMALKKAVDIFIEDDKDKTTGPFLITCNFDRLFLMVNENFEVVCTDDPSKASQFYVIPNDDDDDQFGIAYNAKSSQQDMWPITCYLSVPTNLSGHNPGPLKVTEHPSSKDLSMTIESPLKRSSVPADLDKWVSGEDIFYINCARRFVFSNAYICVKQYKPLPKTAPVVRTTVSTPPDELAAAAQIGTELQELRHTADVQQDDTTPPPAVQPEKTPPTPAAQPVPPTCCVTACVSSKSYHNHTDTFMLFRLVQANLLQPDNKDILLATDTPQLPKM